MKMTEILNELADMRRSVQPTRESITEWYDWISVMRDELVFVPGRMAEIQVRYLDEQLGKLVLMLVSLSVTP